MKIRIILIIGLIISINMQAQESEKNAEDYKYAKQLLEYALKNKSYRTEIGFKLIPKKENAINYAQIILFELYGKEKIESQKPYKVNLINNYWIITGTLPKEMVGGVFEMVFDSRNGKVLILEHGQ
ncbi:YbbC/YhhH family protein [Flavobacteriaceae bacterium]|nr:YbbC/YhhH family protein [Flavobacteriaceae bacterium]